MTVLSWCHNSSYVKDITSRIWRGNPLLASIYDQDLLKFRVHIADEGFDVNEPITGVWTCLDVACYLNRINFVREILRCKDVFCFAVSQQSRRQNALHIACNQGHGKIVQILLQECLNVVGS